MLNEKDRKIKIICIISLVVAVFGMTLGFAAFSSVLKISSNAWVTPSSDNFKIRFVGVDGDNVVKVVGDNTVGHTEGIISSDGLTISNLAVSFSEPGDYVEFETYIENAGTYDAYIKSANMDNIAGLNSKKKCVAVDDSEVSQELLDAACEDIAFGFSLYDEEGNMLTPDFFGAKLAPGKKHYLVLVFKYDTNGTRVDGEFEVIFGDAHLEYTTNMESQDYINSSFFIAYFGVYLRR